MGQIFWAPRSIGTLVKRVCANLKQEISRVTSALPQSNILKLGKVCSKAPPCILASVDTKINRGGSHELSTIHAYITGFLVTIETRKEVAL